MGHLTKLTLSKTSPRQPLTPLARKRLNLLRRLETQLDAANAALADEEFVEEVRKWVRDEAGEKQLVTTEKPVRRWWWQNQHGALMLSLRDGNRLIDMGEGQTAIEVGDLSELPNVLETVRAAVMAGELDASLERVVMSKRKKSMQK